MTNNGSGDAQGLLEKLKDIFESTVEKAVRPPSQLKVTHDHLTKPAQLAVEGKELRQANEEETRKQLVAALTAINSQSGPPKLGMAAAESSKAANGMMLPKLPSEINSILVYNIAAMSYQTQNYGQALLYLKLVLENLDQVEEFIAIKSMFLML